MYSKEEIEKKRLSALALRQKKNINSENVPKTRVAIVPTGVNKNNFQGTSSSNKSNVYRQKSTQNRFDPISTNKFYPNKTESIMGNCIMIKNDRFAVELAKFSASLIELFKTIPTKAYGKIIIYFFI